MNVKSVPSSEHHDATHPWNKIRPKVFSLQENYSISVKVYREFTLLKENPVFCNILHDLKKSIH